MSIGERVAIHLDWETIGLVTVDVTQANLQEVLKRL